MEESFIIVARRRVRSRTEYSIHAMKADIGVVQVVVAVLRRRRDPSGWCAKTGGAGPGADRFATSWAWRRRAESPALLNGDADRSRGSATSSQAPIETGNLPALAMVSDERLGGTMAEVPTSVEQGFDVTIWGRARPSRTAGHAAGTTQPRTGERPSSARSRPRPGRGHQQNQWETHYLTGDR